MLDSSAPFMRRLADVARSATPRASRLLVPLTGAVMLVGVQALEAASGPEITMSLFYLVPVMFVAWHAGAAWGAAAIAVTVIVWHLEDVALLGVPLLRAVQCVNTCLRVVLFSLVVALLTRLRAALEASREISQRKSDMVSLVSHEFNGAITCIDTALYILRRGTTDAEVRKDMEDIIQRTTMRLKNFVSNFLDLSRLESGRPSLEREPMDAVSLASEHVQGVALLASEKEIELHLHAPSYPLEMRADRHVMTLALTNLLSNAIKYTPRGGTVSLTVASDGGGVRFDVDDTGIGISPDEMRRLTQAFYRTEGARRSKQAGFGIGLRVTKQMLEAHGTRLEVRSREGGGTRFSFRIAEGA